MAAEQSAARNASSNGEPKSTRLEGVAGRYQESDALELDRLIHERVRLGIVSALAVNGSLTFTDLRDLLGITDGNLSTHARRLEEAGYLVCTKSHDGRAPKTEFELTATGRRELQEYLDHMEAIIQATRHQSGSGLK